MSESLKKHAEDNFIHYELRQGQTKSEVFSIKSPNTFVCAPDWVREAAEQLRNETKNVSSVRIRDESAAGTSSVSSLLSCSPPDGACLSIFSDLVRLQILSRNEGFSVDGFIQTDMYAPGITDPRVIYSLKDLVRQTVITSGDRTVKYGGYGGTKQENQSANVFVCDLSALQFQRDYNSGRLVLLSADELPSGLLDDLIFRNVVGEDRKSFSEADLDDSNRYVRFQSRIFGPVLFDTFAYKKFVAEDVILAGLALNHLADADSENINFKFLQYGSGYFSEDFTHLIKQNILEGVLEGLELLFEVHKPGRIKNIELPFYDKIPTMESRIVGFEVKYGLKITFTNCDALQSTVPGLITATTNCGDPHAVFGNEMDYGSVDAAIAENLESKGNQFSPIMNPAMREIYFNLKSERSHFD